MNAHALSLGSLFVSTETPYLYFCFAGWVRWVVALNFQHLPPKILHLVGISGDVCNATERYVMSDVVRQSHVVPRTCKHAFLFTQVGWTTQ